MSWRCQCTRRKRLLTVLDQRLSSDEPTQLLPFFVHHLCSTPQRQREIVRITCGASAVDQLLGGGFAETKCITEMYGEFRLVGPLRHPGAQLLYRTLLGTALGPAT